MADEIGEIDLTPQSEASKTASNYITEIDSNGILVHDASYDGTTATKTGWHIGSVLEFLRQGVSRFWIGLKNVSDSSPTVRIGKETGESHMELDYHSLQLIDKDNDAFFHVSDLRGQDGKTDVKETFYGDGSTTEFTLSFEATDTSYAVSAPSYMMIYKTTTLIMCNPAPLRTETIIVDYKTTSEDVKAFTFGSRSTAAGAFIGGYSFAAGHDILASAPYSSAIGYETTASGDVSHAEGRSSTASGDVSHAEGYHTTASGAYSHTEGYHTTASGDNSHAEGFSTTVSGDNSHAEGYGTTASGSYSHTEGYGTTASGDLSHAEGFNTIASGAYSHAQNKFTRASKDAQTVLGTYNEEDTSSTTTHPSDNDNYRDYGKYAAIIGNGTADDARSNALAVRWDGLVDQAGRTAYPTFVYDTKPANSDPPVLPCFVLDKSDYGLYYYD